MLRMLRVVLVAFAVVVASLASAGPVTATSERPFKGTIVGGGGVVSDLSCPIGLRTLSDGSGNASHLGLMTMDSSHCTPNPPAGNPPGPILGGVGQFVAANGDMIEFTYHGTLRPLEPVEGATISGTSHHTITGGTGRFANAAGEFEMSFRGTLHFTSPMTITWWFEGTIEY